MTTIQIIEKEYPTIKNIYHNVTKKQIDTFIKTYSNNTHTIKIIK